MTLLAALLLWVVLGVIFCRRAPGRMSSLFSIAAVTCLCLYCWPPVAWLNAASLEKRYPVTFYPAEEADAIVVLSAGFYPANPSQRETVPNSSTYVRCSHAAWLYKNWRPLPIVVSGGVGPPGGPAIAEVMKRQLVKEGIPPSTIAEESRSGSTYENAVNTANILLPRGIRRIVLVTEGHHMLRAELSFRKQGFEVVPAPCAYSIFDLTTPGEVLIPRGWAIRTNDECLHEWAGLVIYKLRGWI
jgi:uncharacterized SAM-binding protein YcdF (DUF218 family)